MTNCIQPFVEGVNGKGSPALMHCNKLSRGRLASTGQFLAERVDLLHHRIDSQVLWHSTHSTHWLFATYNCCSTGASPREEGRRLRELKDTLSTPRLVGTTPAPKARPFKMRAQCQWGTLV